MDFKNQSTRKPITAGLGKMVFSAFCLTDSKLRTRGHTLSLALNHNLALPKSGPLKVRLFHLILAAI